MYLLAGVSVLSLVVLVWSVALILCRKPNRSWYNEENMQAYVWTPFCTSGAFFGVLLIIKSLPEFPPSIAETVLVAGTVFITLIIYRLLKVKKRLSAYEAFETKGKIFPSDQDTGPSTSTSSPLGQDNINFKIAA